MIITYDLHIHSALSPCAETEMTPGNIVGISFLNGLNLIALTDHQSCANVHSAMAAAERIRKEKGSAPLILPGMEIECAEGFHMLAYFPSIDVAVSFEEYLHKNRIQIPNRPDIFGEQYLFDDNDDICGTVQNLLSTASTLSSIQLMSDIHAIGGLMIPAHIDRNSYSILTSLGCIPEEIPVGILEISKNCAKKLFLKEHEELTSYEYIQNSDAHRLCDIADPGSRIELPSLSLENFDAEHVLRALREVTFK
jgi:PHP family Zn ribbon phosphoesterase